MCLKLVRLTLKSLILTVTLYYYRGHWTKVENILYSCDKNGGLVGHHSCGDYWKLINTIGNYLIVWRNTRSVSAW